MSANQSQSNQSEKKTKSLQVQGTFLSMQLFMAEDSSKQPWSTVHLTSDTGFHCVHMATTAASQTSTALPHSSRAVTNGSAKSEVAGEIKTRQPCSELNHDSNKTHQHGNGAHQHNSKHNHESIAPCNPADSAPSIPSAQSYSDPSQRREIPRCEGSKNHDLLYIGSMFADERTAGARSSRNEGNKTKGLLRPSTTLGSMATNCQPRRSR
ncbi:hypothetical protein CLCR_02119 [Cladophialophora carrionii]|uniref:Uncharacterized protein n=1 Tax=Cladophialophora carrionii TaxID=86049 RepID=A0A1C1CDW6_9EURO|nr:hypothetical protein CLCR_02119 [Cladophialophora carrionii]